MKLDERLKTIADMVPLNARIADIGTDHAYLPLFLVQEGKIQHAIASDINKGPYLAAKDTIHKSDLTQIQKNNISTRLGNGLETLISGEADTLIIAGMGGMTIIDILKAHPAIVESFSKLILQPMNAAEKVREYLSEIKWQIVDEELVLRKHSNNIIYQIIAFEKTDSNLCVEPIFFEVGPILFEKKHPLLKVFIAEKISSLRKIISSLEKSNLNKNLQKHEELLDKIKKLEDKYSCL